MREGERVEGRKEGRKEGGLLHSSTHIFYIRHHSSNGLAVKGWLIHYSQC